ncbi:(d)CMP kinase [Nitrosomonas sp. Nm132]|jgi:cytidylate kinase|uniref:(d)CMP kinase n=1 Tax=Nitrosomonas sp. Nm132 TaxID=1881053 RepID=UPI000882B27F|nr:(d)CMP kinase [Nitrosomonas sp. Nm132]SDH52164.1 cytidylate kinase [Nitrosomonas sp. Nm132]
METGAIPVITIDGPSASGKGTVAQLVAQKLAFHYLDSGALYRLVALIAMRSNTDSANELAIANIALHLDVNFYGSSIQLNSEDVSDAIRTEECSKLASVIAGQPEVRRALLQRQRAFLQPPGLVTDGRDMGSVVFPDAPLKIFLTASAEERAQRRYKQLIEKGINANIQSLLQDISERDMRDSNRDTSPLKQETDAKLLDTTLLSIEEAVNEVLRLYNQICKN